MRELLAELPALTVALPAISIALPIFSVLLLSAIFHWLFVPDKKQQKEDQDLPDEAPVKSTQQFSTNGSSAKKEVTVEGKPETANRTFDKISSTNRKQRIVNTESVPRSNQPGSKANYKWLPARTADSPPEDKPRYATSMGKNSIPDKNLLTENRNTDSRLASKLPTKAGSSTAQQISTAVQGDPNQLALPTTGTEADASIVSKANNADSISNKIKPPADDSSESVVARLKAQLSNKPGPAAEAKTAARSEQPKYRTAAKTRYIPSSIEAQLQLRTPGTTKAHGISEQSITTPNNGNSKLLAEKDRVIQQLEARLDALQKQTTRQNTSPVTVENDNDPIDKTADRSDTTESANNLNVDPAQNASASSVSNPQSLAGLVTKTEKQNASLPVGHTADDEAEHGQFKRRYEEASDKLVLNEQKIQKLQSTVNRLQASGLQEVDENSKSTGSRTTLLSKVRVLAPSA